MNIAEKSKRLQKDPMGDRLEQATEKNNQVRKFDTEGRSVIHQQAGKLTLNKLSARAAFWLPS
jgi:hypothetical protein